MKKLLLATVLSVLGFAAGAQPLPILFNPGDPHSAALGGTGVALELAENSPSKAVLLQAPFLSGRRLIEFWMQDGMHFPTEAKPFPSEERIARLTCPVAAIHGTDDNVVPFSQGEALYAAAPQKAGFTAVPAAGHNDLLAVLGPFRYKAIVEFLLA